MEDGSVAIAQASTDGWIPKFVKDWKVNDFTETDLAIKGRSFNSGALAFKTHRFVSNATRLVTKAVSLDPTWLNSTKRNKRLRMLSGH